MGDTKNEAIATADKQETPESASKDASAKEKTFGLDDIARRWKCPVSSVENQVKFGFPMYKNSNDRWRIKESDLVAWEKKEEEKKAAKEIEAKRIKRNNMIAYIVGGFFVAVFGFMALLIFTNA